MKLHNGIKRFSGQGIHKFKFILTQELKNIARKHYFSSNHKNAPRDTLMTESGLNKLHIFKREKQNYTKTNGKMVHK